MSKIQNSLELCFLSSSNFACIGGLAKVPVGATYQSRK